MKGISHFYIYIFIIIYSYIFFSTKRNGGKGLSKNATKLPIPDIYRANEIFKDDIIDNSSLGYKFAEIASKHILNASEKGIAGFIVESIMGCGGQIVFPDNYLKNIFKLIRDNGGLCITDEVQVGFGRCGEHWWAFETQNVIPDIVTLGKRMELTFLYK